MLPQVSIVMGVYNGGSTLTDTLDSLLKQTLRDWELIVVNDASLDATSHILNEYAATDRRIRVIHLEQNKGLTNALIVACQAASAEFLARQDAGDLSLSERLARQVEFLNENPSVVAVGIGYRRIGPRGEILGEQVRKLTPSEVTESFISTGKAILHAGAVIRRPAYMSAGGYRIQFSVAQDIDLWYRLLKFGLLAEIDEVLLCIQINATGISAMSNAKQHALADIARSIYSEPRHDDSQSKFLEEAARISLGQPQKRLCTNGSQFGEANYFLGSELFNARHPNCRKYLLRSILCRTHVFASLCKFLISFALCTSHNSINHEMLARMTSHTDSLH